jgi:hypothetical protein
MIGEQYRRAAEEARKHAERATGRVTKEEWLKIAAGWSRLADARDKAERETG